MSTNYFMEMKTSHRTSWQLRQIFFFFWYNKKETETGIGHKWHPKRHAAKQSISILITPVYFAGFTFADH
jgi:hypothetical protein